MLIVTLATSGDAYGRIYCDSRLFGLLGTPIFSKRTLRLRPLWQSSCTSNRLCIHRYTECDMIRPNRVGHWVIFGLKQIRKVELPMSLYAAYLEEIEKRKEQGLNPKPIDDAALTEEIIAQIKDTGHAHREQSLKFFIYNTLPGTTSAAGVKAEFLKEIVLGQTQVAEITVDFAFELLSHMKGGPSVRVLLDVALGDNADLAAQAAEVLKTQVFLYDADTDRLKEAFNAGNAVAKDILESYSDAEFFTKLPDVEQEIKVVTYIAAEGDISTDLLSPGNQAHSRSDRELHGKCMISEQAQKEIEALKLQHPDKRVMLIAEKGTMGVGSSRMSGVNNVALWTGKQASPYVPFVNIAPVVAGTNHQAVLLKTACQ
jgi:aconitate hydratase 2/2-methylisocitrate dehydratase